MSKRLRGIKGNNAVKAFIAAGGLQGSRGEVFGDVG